MKRVPPSQRPYLWMGVRCRRQNVFVSGGKRHAQRGEEVTERDLPRGALSNLAPALARALCPVKGNSRIWLDRREREVPHLPFRRESKARERAWPIGAVSRAREGVSERARPPSPPAGDPRGRTLAFPSVTALKKVDLPTLGLPTHPITTSIGPRTWAPQTLVLLLLLLQDKYL